MTTTTNTGGSMTTITSSRPLTSVFITQDLTDGVAAVDDNGAHAMFDNKGFYIRYCG